VILQLESATPAFFIDGTAQIHELVLEALVRKFSLVLLGGRSASDFVSCRLNPVILL